MSFTIILFNTNVHVHVLNQSYIVFYKSIDAIYNDIYIDIHGTLFW